MAERSAQHVWRAGENAAADLLRSEGFRIIKRNFKTKIGEIDVIAEEDDILCFVEVKARSSEKHGAPAEAVTPRKQSKIAKIAAAYLAWKHPEGRTCRFDVVSVLEKDGQPVVELIRDAFRSDGKYTV